MFDTLTFSTLLVCTACFAAFVLPLGFRLLRGSTTNLCRRCGCTRAASFCANCGLECQ